MTKASDNIFPKIIESMNTSDQAAPSDSSWKIYAKAGGIFARSSNAVVGPFASAGSGMTNPLTTTGDMIYSSSGTTPARLAIGSNGQFVRTNATPLPVWDVPPGFEFDYAEKRVSVSVTATTEGAADTILTGNAVTYDGSTVVMVEFFAMSARPDNGGAARTLSLYLYDGSSSIGRIGNFITPAAQTDSKPAMCVRRLTPSNAAHTYSVRGAVSAGTGNVGAGIGGSGADVPMFLRITKV